MTHYHCGIECDKCRRCADRRRHTGPDNSRRSFLRQMSYGLALCGVSAIGAACRPSLASPPAPETAAPEPHSTEPTAVDPPTPSAPREWQPPDANTGTHPTGDGDVSLRGVGDFTFNAGAVQTLRSDIFKPPHFSIFDVAVHLAEAGDIDLEYHFDETMDTHVIDALNGTSPWWYQAYYDNGWPESNAFRMDMFPYKNNMTIRLGSVDQARMDDVHQSFRDEATRLEDNGGAVIIPDLTIRSPGYTATFQDVLVTPHNLRDDVLQPGVITALDALISLWERREIPELKLTWYERIGSADPVDSYWVEQMERAYADGGCGFVYETGDRRFPGFEGSHIHLPADVRVTISPEYALWFWICL